MSERLPQSTDNSNPIAVVFQRSTDISDVSQWEPLETISRLRLAMEQMPDGKTGIVLGSGKNTLKWKKRGWLTLDIDPVYQSDFVLDANNLEALFQNQFDFVLAENITFHPLGINGVSPVRLLDQADKTLKIGGELIIKSAHLENISSSLPNRYQYSQLMYSHGFKTVVEISGTPTDRQSKQIVTYYGKKMC